MQTCALSEQICTLIDTNLDTVFKLRYDMTLKEDNTPVTKADVFLENLIKNFLESQIESLAFIGEETYKNEYINLLEKEYVVILDPIDGTENFTSGLKEWGVSFGLWYKGVFQEGFIYLPEMGLKLCTGDKVNPGKSRVVGLSSGINDEFISSLKPYQQYRIMGCAVYNLYNVIYGHYVEFSNPVGAKVWDVLPGIMLALEQGCKVMINNEEFQGEHFLNPVEKYKIKVIR